MLFRSKQIAMQHGIRVTVESDIKHAVNNLKTGIIEGDIVIITGSLYLVGESLEYAGLIRQCLDIY